MDSVLLEKILKILEDKKAIDIKTMPIKEVSTIADYFVIATGTSNTHIKSLADNLEKELKEEGITPFKIEGYNSAEWILVDYGEVIVHLFNSEQRQNYDLETLWENAKKNLKE